MSYVPFLKINCDYKDRGIIVNEDVYVKIDEIFADLEPKLHNQPKFLPFYTMVADIHVNVKNREAKGLFYIKKLASGGPCPALITHNFDKNSSFSCRNEVT